MARMKGRRALVVGASSGIGRAIALELVREGASVVATARRSDRLETLRDEAGAGIEIRACDVREGDQCEESVAFAAKTLAGLDALVYAAGTATLCPLSDADAELWRETLDINVVGASLVTRAALPHLCASRGRALYLSSIAASGPPRPGLSLYATSKAALDRLIEGWHDEAREVGFTRVSVGDTGGTEMASGWSEEAGRYAGEWVKRGLLFGRTMEPETIARHVVDLLACSETVAFSSIVPRFPDA